MAPQVSIVALPQSLSDNLGFMNQPQNQPTDQTDNQTDCPTIKQSHPQPIGSTYLPELLLPVGTPEMALAAIHNGADAIYIGVPGFNARGRTVDFDLDSLRATIEMAHLYGVRVNLALNILIFQEELATVAELLTKIIPLKPDAFIVQDLGLIRLIRAIAPEQPIHASTQMTVTNHEAIHLLQDLNIRRFVLGRENSLNEIKLIKDNTSKELEVFVHGALCVSYSGQCFTSESIGGRSANRGQCAQSCRYTYELYVDGSRHRNTIDREYLVSPHDLCGISEIPELMDIGVKSFKIEGRLKTPEYVAAAARDYRKAIDAKLGGKRLSAKAIGQSIKSMSSTYSRGFFSGWLHGVNHQKLVDGTYSAHRGLKVGVVSEVRPEGLVAKLGKDIQLKAGDGLVWVFKSPMGKSAKLQVDPEAKLSATKTEELTEAGGQIYQVSSLGADKYLLRFSNNKKMENRFEGAELYLNSDAELNRELNKSFTQKELLKKIPVKISMKIDLGKVLEAQIDDGVHVVFASTQSLVQRAEKREVLDAFIFDEMQSLGGTVFELKGPESLKIQRLTKEPVFVSHKELKELRRELTEKLAALRSEERVEKQNVSSMTSTQALQWLEDSQSLTASGNSLLVGTKSKERTLLNVLLRERAQVDDFVQALNAGEILMEGLGVVILDFEFGRDFSGSVDKLKAAGVRVGIATTRILKPQEYLNLRVIENLKPDVILVRNLGALRYYSEVSKFSGEVMGDFSLNVTNHLTANYLLTKGLNTLCASYDLNSQQVNDLLARVEPARVEVTAHQYMPSFHMEHCVFAAFLSAGTSFKDCGKPCEKHRLELRDQYGNHHQIKPDQECRNTMYNSTSASAAKFIPAWQSLGLGVIRFEALRERGQELVLKIRGYQNLLAGEEAVDSVVDRLELTENYGLQDLHLSRDKKHQDRKKHLNSQNYGRPSR